MARQRAARATSSSSVWSNGGGSGVGGGTFQLTAYEWTGNRCANGEYPVVGYSCASNYYPLGTVLEIEGIGRRVVTDTGGMGMGVIDVYMGDPAACIQFGRKYDVEVTVVTDDEGGAEEW